MGVYLGAFSIVSLAAAIIQGSKTSENAKRKKFLMFAFGVLAFLSAMRSLTVGADTFAYEAAFYRAQNISLHEVFSTFDITQEVGFYILENIFSHVIGSYRIWLTFIAILSMYSFGKFIYERSVSPYLSFVTFFVFFFSFFGTTGLRQTLAQSICLLFSYKYIEQRKLIPFTISVLFAATFHKSALLLLPFYFVYNIRVKKSMCLSFMAGLLIMWIGRHFFLGKFSAFLGYNEQYNAQIAGAGTLMFSLFMICVIVFAFALLIGNKRIDNEIVSKHVLACVCAALFLPFTFIDPNLIRAMYYYSIYLMLLIADLPLAFRGTSRILCAAAIVFLLMFTLLSGNPHYLFFWS